MSKDTSPSFKNIINQPGSMQKLQYSWTKYGIEAQRQIEINPGNFLIDSSPYREWIWGSPLLDELGVLKGIRILELGSGLGKFSTYMAKQGAKVTGIDLSRETVRISRKISKTNKVDCQFMVGDITRLNFKNSAFDLVVGVAILHHLSKPDVSATLKEVHRILRNQGKAVFLEPIENSQFFSFLQNLIPAGEKSSGYYRPSIIFRKSWKEYVLNMEDREMTTSEFLENRKYFQNINFRGFGLLTRLDRLSRNPRFVNSLKTLDNWAFSNFPFLEKYARNLLVVYVK